MAALHHSGISQERWDSLVQWIERRVPKTRMFYIGRTNDPARRRRDHQRSGRRVFDCMPKVTEFRTIRVCKSVEEALIRHFKVKRDYYRCDNEACDGRGGEGPGMQYLYMMWEER